VQHSEENGFKMVEESTIPLRERLTWPPGPADEKYPYEEWFDGSVWRLKMYEDFFVHPKSMQSAIYQSARRKNLKVKTHIPTTCDAIYLQVIKDD
jgi:hypothetical protein